MPQLFQQNPLNPSHKKNFLVVSLHDVSPLTYLTIEEQLCDLKALGVTYCSLLVIPNHHKKGYISEDASFIAWLKKKEKEGHEIVLHGYEHLRSCSKKENFLTRLITERYTAGEGEFYDLSYEEAIAKVQQGLFEFRKIGLSKEKVIGFIAPAWLLSQKAEQVLHDLGFSYTTRLHGVIDLKKSPSNFIPSQSMVYSVRAVWRRLVSLLWNELLFKYAQQRKWPLLRLGLHPVDWKYRSIRSHILSTIKRVLETREAMTYASWIENKEQG